MASHVEPSVDDQTAAGLAVAAHHQQALALGHE